jgi:hypothetical protein
MKTLDNLSVSEQSEGVNEQDEIRDLRQQT